LSLLAARRLLGTMSKSDNEAAIIDAAQALSEMPGRHVRRGLERLLVSHDSPRVRAQAAWALGFHPDGAEAAEALLGTLADAEEETEVRAHAAEALGHMADRLGDREADVLAALLRGLTDTSAYVRFWSAFALGNLGDDRAIPALERLAARDTQSVPGWWSIRKEALDSIEQIRLQQRNRGGTPGVDEE
jgi:HEAT repeat protein